jgi:hypothetical protein
LARRLFLVELDPKAFDKDLSFHGIGKRDEFNIIETFIPRGDGKLIQLLSSSRKLLTPHDPLDLRWSKAEFIVKSNGWKLEKAAPRQEITSEEYYELLIGETNAAVEQKSRTVFNAFGRRYSLEMNHERNYAVIQVDYEGDYSAPYENLFKGLRALDVVGELFMSLEETFCRLYLKPQEKVVEELHPTSDIRL